MIADRATGTERGSYRSDWGWEYYKGVIAMWGQLKGWRSHHVIIFTPESILPKESKRLRV